MSCPLFIGGPFFGLFGGFFGGKFCGGAVGVVGGWEWKGEVLWDGVVDNHNFVA